MSMIKLINIAVVGDRELELTFNDGSHATWSADKLIARDTELTRPLAISAYFKRAFLEGGALAWPNGLEFSPVALHSKLEKAGLLVRRAA
jgi:hypothetical protein